MAFRLKTDISLCSVFDNLAIVNNGSYRTELSLQVQASFIFDHTILFDSALNCSKLSLSKGNFLSPLFHLLFHILYINIQYIRPDLGNN